MRTSFTKNEIKRLRELIMQRCNADSSKQKSIRSKMREIGFYGEKQFGIKDMTIQKFNQLIDSGAIQIIGESEKDSNKTSAEKKNKGIPKQEELQLNKKEDASVENQCICFHPLIDKNSEILVLGTMPGKQSLETKEYYANTTNSFWKIIKDLFNNKEEFKDYKEKCECLKKNGIALWDVLAACERKDSLDENIEKETPNDIKKLLQEYPNIKRIIFNGKNPKKKFAQDIKCDLFTAPSTSGANTTMTYEEKFEDWKKLLILTNK